MIFGVLIGLPGDNAENTAEPGPTRTVTATRHTLATGSADPTAKDRTPPAGDIPGDGVFLVGEDIQPGTYRSDGADTALCYWARLSDTTGEADDIIANGNAKGQIVVKIAPADAAFEASDCKPWTKIG
ncbi:hypothetical protein [Streptomyces sp. NPDC047928]|uniref:hypothetical protein n=1 Tax=unclassified Streptomyces TaxID=2593676 RepID=UPI003715E388